MKINKSIQLKAAILLTVFALNTVVSFACSLGLKMGYNNHHHEQESKAATSGHHHEGAVAAHHSHHHNEVAAGHHQNDVPEKDDCCNKNAVQIQHADKSLVHAAGFIIKAPVFVAFMSAYLGLEMKHDKLITGVRYFVSRYYPPPDIRIAIQSFQI